MRLSRADVWFVGLAALAAHGCTSAPPAGSPPAAAAPAKSSFGGRLSLGLSLGNAPSVGDTSVRADFRLTNNGSAAFEGCFGPAWGVSVIVDGHNAGHVVRADYPTCVEKVSLLPSQTIVWSRTVPLGRLRAGPAKVTGWVRVVDPATCQPSRGCRDVSVASPTMTVDIGSR